VKVPILAASPDGRYKVSHRLVEFGGRLRLDSEMVCLYEDGRDPRLLEPLLNWAVICAALSCDGALAVGLEPFPELYPYVERLDETIAILDIHGSGEFNLMVREVDQRNAQRGGRGVFRRRNIACRGWMAWRGCLGHGEPRDRPRD
jgi:hypothetical protein